MSRLPWRFGALCAAAIATTAPSIAQGQGAAPRSGARAPEKPLPLEVGRTFSLDTREGTWLSLDVSPDGATIAYALVRVSRALDGHIFSSAAVTRRM